MTLALDHVFAFVEPAAAAPGGAAHDTLTALGLVPSYSRRHAGQGTANFCFCFDNAYLELLFVVDEEELAAPAIARAGLHGRSRWRENGASPFGIAVRGGDLPGETWRYRFDGFPPGVSIAVAAESGDARLPFVFGAVGTQPPSEWTNGLAGARQSAAGLAGLSIERIGLAPDAPRSPLLDALVSAGVVGTVDRTGRGLTLRLGDRIRLELPGFVAT